MNYKVLFLFSVFFICTSAFSARKKNIFKMKSSSGLLSHDTATRTSQKEIDAFWNETRKELAAVPMNVNVTKVKEALPYRKYKIVLQSLGGVSIVGYLSLPVQGESPAKPWPVIVTASGYGGNQQGIMLGECQRGYAILQVFPRGQGPSAEYFKLRGDKLTLELKKPEGAYYQGAYTDVIRMIDYIVTRPDIDSSRIALAATSQGAGISLAVASLDSRVKVVVAHVPFLCNMRLAATMPSLVRGLLDKAKANNDKSLHTLDYFDPLNLVSHLHVPVLMSAGGKDHTCPQQTIRSVYKRINSIKELKFYPNLAHTTCLDFYNYMWRWLDHYFR